MPFSLGQLASKLDHDQCNKLKEFYKVDEVFKLTRRKVYISMSTQTAERNLKRQSYYQRVSFTASLPGKVPVMKNLSMHRSSWIE